MNEGTARSGPASRMTGLETLWRFGTVGGLKDGVLLDRFLSGDAAQSSVAFEALVNRHGPMVLRVCRQALGSPHDADDAGQAVFLVLARRAGAVRHLDDLGPWLYGVARRVARRARADADRRRGREAPLAHDPVAPDDRAGAWADLYHELDRLPDRERSPVVLCHLEGLSQDQAAARLGWTLRTLQRRLTDGRARLRHRLARRGVTAPALLATAAAFLDGTAVGGPAPPAPSWAVATARAAAGFARTPSRADAAATLARGVLSAMFWTEIRRHALIVALAGSAALGLARAATVTFNGPADDPLAAKPEAPAPQPDVGRAFDGTPPDTARWHTAGVVVLDDASGEPIPDAQVRVLEFVSLRYHDFKTDPAGRARFEYPAIAAEDSGASLEIRKPGYVPQRHSIGGQSPLPADAEVTVRLRTGVPIGGTVVDEANAGVSGATVVITASGLDDRHPRPKLVQGTEITWELPVTTDRDGRWTSAEVSPAAGKVTLQIFHPDYVSGGGGLGTGPGLRFASMDGLKARTDRQVLKKGVKVTGRVADSSGEPVAGATVTDTTAGYSFLEYLRRASTDADGWFAFHFEPGEQLTLTVTAPGLGLAPVDQPLRVEPGRAPLEISLPPAKVLRVRVVDGQGNPIPGVGAFIPARSRFSGVFFRQYTDSQGRFRWDDAPDAEIPLYFSRSGYRTLAAHPVRPTDGEVTVTLKPAITVTVKPRDARTGDPIASCAVETGTVDPTSGLVTWNSRDRYMLREKDPAAFEFASEPDSRYRLRVSVPGYKPFVNREIKWDEGAVELAVALEPIEGPGFKAVVRAPDGGPASGAQVVTGNATLTAGKVERTGPESLRATADAEGAFLLPGVESPFPFVVVAGQGYALVDQDPGAEVKLSPWGRVEGVLKVGKNVAASQAVSLSSTPVRPLNGPTFYQHDATRTDAEGRFAFDRVLPARDVAVQAPGVGGIQVWTDVRPGETARVTVGGEGRPVVGRVSRPEGVSEEDWAGADLVVRIRSDLPPVPPRPDDAPADWLTTWWNSDEGRAYRRNYVSRAVQEIGPGGSFRFDDVAEGDYRLAVTARTGTLPGRGPISGKAWTVVRPFRVLAAPDGPVDLGPLSPAPLPPNARPEPPASSPPRAP